MGDQEHSFINWPIIQLEDFIFTPLHVILMVSIYVGAKLFVKYIKRYFKAHNLTDKQLTIEGREIAVWSLIRQIIYLIAFYLCFLSLKIKNPDLSISSVLSYEFFRIERFHIAVYHIFLTIAIVFFARVIVNFLKVIILKAVLSGDRIGQGTRYVYMQLIKYLVYGITIIVLLRSFGVDLDLFLTATTFLLVGVGLGLQSIFRDYFSGILLLFEGAIKVGDVVEIESLGPEGNFIAKVVQINLRTSKVETRNEKILIIPNSKLTHENVINWSVGTQITRFSIPITFHYGVDTKLVRSILINAASAHPRVIKTKKPIVRLLNFGSNGLEMDLVFWADQNLLIEILKSEIRFDIDERLRAHNISIPYTQNDIHLFEKSKPEEMSGSSKIND